MSVSPLAVNAVGPSTAIKIKSVALALFVRHGYAATSIREIAGGVGIKTASLYHFFPSKESLLAELIVECQTVLNETTERVLKGVDRPEDRLALLVTSLTGFQAIYSTAGVTMDGEIHVLEPSSPARLELVANRDRYEKWWVDALQQGVEEGVFRIRDHRTTRLALIAMCTGVSQWYRENGPSSLAEICRSMADVALSSVNADRDGHQLGVDDVPAFDLDDLTRLEWLTAVALPGTQDHEQARP